MAIASVHIIGSKALGGAERFFSRLTHALADDGHPTRAIVRTGSDLALHPSSVPQFQVPMRAVWDWPSALQIGYLLRRERPQIVQTYMGRATRLTRAKPKGIVHVARLGGFYKLDGYRHADAWVGNTEAICNYLRQNGFPGSRIFHIPNFVDLPSRLTAAERVQGRRTWGIPEDALLVLAVGRLIAKKGFGDLLEAFAHLPKTVGHRPVHLMVVGDGELSGELKNAAVSLNVADRTHWPGWQKQTDSFYGMADVFVCPSLHEPLGNVILEAWAHALPVVSTATDGAEALIDDGVNGLCTPCGASGPLGSRIHSLLRDEAARRELGRMGEERLNARYSRRSVLAAYIDLYSRLTS